MRITVVTGPFYGVPPAPCGAVERRWRGLCDEFAKRGHEVTLLARADAGLPREERADGVVIRRRTRRRHTRRLPYDLLQDVYYSMRMLALAPPGDIVVPNVFWLPALLPRLRPSRGRVIAHVARFPKGQVRLYLRCALITTPSTAVAEAIVRQCPQAAAKVRVIPNCIRTEVFHPRSAASHPGAGRRLIYTGRIHPEKGLHLLVEAWTRLRADLPELELVLMGQIEVEAGGGGEPYVRRLRELAGAHGGAMEIRPPVYDQQRLAEALRSADYYCYPSLAEQGESFGVAPLEAMGVGLVPIVSDLGCFREFIDDGRTGVVFDHRGPDPAGAIAAALHRVIDDPQAAERMSAAAARRAAEFGYGETAARYLEAFASVLEGEAAHG